MSTQPSNASFGQFTDVMVDIEGCSEFPDAAPHEIALIFFTLGDPEGERKEAQWDIAAIDGIKLGMSVSQKTLAWWAENLRKPLNLSIGTPLALALEDIAKAIATNGTEDIRVWSRGNDYDIAILRLALRLCKIELPWQYHRARDVRSFMEGRKWTKRRDNTHVAKEDATNQVLDVLEALHGKLPEPDTESAAP